MKVIFLDTVHDCLQERLESAGFVCDLHTDTPVETVQQIIGGYDGIVIRSRWRMDATFLAAATNLKFIARSGAGMENIDESYCESQGIVLFNAPEGNRNAVGEHALGLLLSLMNKLHSGNNEVKNGKWDREGNRGFELTGLTVGIIGFGNNGSAFAEKLKGFNCKILAYDKYKSDYGNPGQNIHESTPDQIASEADVLSFHIPQTEETIGLFDEAYLDRFAKPIWLINCARGKIVKTSAVVNGLRDGSLLGAGLDVLEYEKASFERLNDETMPEDFQQLLANDRVILSPHVAGWSVESYRKLSEVLADKILAQYGN